LKETRLQAALFARKKLTSSGFSALGPTADSSTLSTPKPGLPTEGLGLLSFELDPLVPEEPSLKELKSEGLCLAGTGGGVEVGVTGRVSFSFPGVLDPAAVVGVVE